MVSATSISSLLAAAGPCRELALCAKKCSNASGGNGNPDFPCFGGCRCPAPHCLLFGGRCVTSPFYYYPGKPSSPSSSATELVCKGLDGGDEIPQSLAPPPPRIPLNSVDLRRRAAGEDSSYFGKLSASPTQEMSWEYQVALQHARVNLQRFKRATSWLFARMWMDWGEMVPYGGHDKKRRQRRAEIDAFASANSKYDDEEAVLDESDEFHRAAAKKLQEEQDIAESANGQLRAVPGVPAAPPVDGSNNNNNKKKTMTSMKKSSEQLPLPRFVPPENSGLMVGEHDLSSGLYTMSNICIRSEGSPAAFKPRIKQYKGKPETETVVVKKLLRFTTHYIASTESLPLPPKLVLDMNTLLMPVDWPANNPGHIFYRSVAATRIAERMWGRSAKFHVIYLINQDNVSSPSGSLKKQRDELEGLKYFYPIVGHSWSVVWRTRPSLALRQALFAQGSRSVSPEALHREATIELANFDPAAAPPTSAAKNNNGLPMTCFANVVVHQVCHEKCNWSAKRRPGNQYMVPYVGAGVHLPEHFSAIYRFRSLLASCVDKEDAVLMRKRASWREQQQQGRQDAALQTTSVTLIGRFSWRVDFGLAAAAPAIALAIERSASSNQFDPTTTPVRFQVASQHSLTPAQYMRLLLDTDVLIGSMGASLSFAFLLPRGGVLVEIAGTSSCSRGRPGFNNNLKCEFGGMCLSRGVHHLAITLPKQSVPQALPTPGIYPGVALYEKATRIALCKLRSLKQHGLKRHSRSADSEFCVANARSGSLEFDYATWTPDVDS